MVNCLASVKNDVFLSFFTKQIHTKVQSSAITQITQ